MRRIQLPDIIPSYKAVLPTYLNLSTAIMHNKKSNKTISLRFSSSARTNNTTFAYQCIMSGMGIGYLPSCQITKDLANNQLEDLLPGYVLPQSELFAVLYQPGIFNTKIKEHSITFF